MPREQIKTAARYLIAVLAISLLTIFQLESAVQNFWPVSVDEVVAASAASFAPKGRAFFCGFPLPVKHMFPEYTFQETRWTPNRVPRNTTEADILVIGMHGPCASTDIETIALRQFAGKVLYVNAESRGNVFDMVPRSWIMYPENNPQVRRLYQIGPYNGKHGKIDQTEYETLYSRQSLLVYQSAIYFAKLQDYAHSNASEWLTIPSKRPQNSEKYNAIAFIASNCWPPRQAAALTLSKVVAPVHYGGVCTVRGLNTSRIPSKLLTDRSSFNANDRIFRHYKYCLVMENSKSDGYITEKLINAYRGGCLPIYYGTLEVYNVFHPDGFIFYNISNPQPALDLLQRLEANASLYNEMATAPILRHGQESFDEYFSLLPFLGNGSINGKIHRMMGMEEVSHVPEYR